MEFELTFFEPVLGTVPGSKAVAAEFIVGKLLTTLSPKQQRQLFSTTDERKEFIRKVASGMVVDIKQIPEDLPEDIAEKFEQELAAIAAEGDVEKSSTIFPRSEGLPFVWDYQVRGFLKTACEAMQLAGEMTQKDLKALRLTPYLYKKTIDLMVFPKPRRIPILLPAGTDAKNLDFLERPLRAQTMKGERICLARSEIVPPGSKIVFEIVSLQKDLEPIIRKWMDYGEYHGFLQWRSGGYGRFHWRETTGTDAGKQG